MLSVYAESFSPSLDTAVSHALLRMVADGDCGESLRLYRPDDVVAFGKRDVVTHGFLQAVESAGKAGFDSIIRLAGGRAAVFHRDTVAFAWTMPAPSPRAGINERFERLSDLLLGAFRALGADARIGEVPGEYCPGEFSINLGGRSKVMGVGQRLIAGAAHLGGVIVVDRGDRIAEVLVPVYRDLGLEWDPGTSGDLASGVPGLTWPQVHEAVLGSFAEIADIAPAAIPAAVLARAKGLEPAHAVGNRQ
ncbi:MAG: lipoate--protein ligase family protein [Acidimicrobiia bacterium]|nr:lipoate--protein ligase family protein [Acidimicrobiia bacterium]